MSLAMAFCTYLYRDLKTSVLRYVGKGLMSQTFHSRSPEEKAKTFALLSSKKKAMWNSWSDEQRQSFADKQSKIKSRRCTVDGITIYESRLDLIKALGQSRSGSRSPNFRYV